MSNFNGRPNSDKKDKKNIWNNVQNTGRGAKLMVMRLIAGAEAAAWIIAFLTLAGVIYANFKGYISLADPVLYAICFSAVLLGGRLGWEFIAYLNKQGAQYER